MPFTSMKQSKSFIMPFVNPTKTKALFCPLHVNSIEIKIHMHSVNQISIKEIIQYIYI